MKRALFTLALLGVIGFLLGCTKDEKADQDAGVDASIDDGTDAGDGDDDGQVRKKCADVGPLHKCVGWDDCAVYNMRTQFICPNALFVCCVDWTPPFADAGADASE